MKTNIFYMIFIFNCFIYSLCAMVQNNNQFSEQHIIAHIEETEDSVQITTNDSLINIVNTLIIAEKEAKIFKITCLSFDSFRQNSITKLLEHVCNEQVILHNTGLNGFFSYISCEPNTREKIDVLLEHIFMQEPRFSQGTKNTFLEKTHNLFNLFLQNNNNN